MKTAITQGYTEYCLIVQRKAWNAGIWKKMSTGLPEFKSPPNYVSTGTLFHPSESGEGLL